MYRRALQLMKQRPRALIWPVVAGTISILLVWGLSATGAAGAALGTILAIYVMDAGRAASTLELAGNRPTVRGILNRLCVDSFFLAAMFLLLVVVPAVQALAVQIGDYYTASIVGIVWYAIAIATILLAIRWFHWGYITSVEERDPERALAEAAERFKDNRKSTVKLFVAYWLPAVAWLLGNALVQDFGILGAITSLATLCLIVMPIMEAVYVAAREQ